MGVEVKSGGEGVIVADRGCNDGCCCNGRNSGWGSGWGALVGGGFGAAAVSVWDKINDTKADIQKVESTVQEAKAGIYKDISDAAEGIYNNVYYTIDLRNIVNEVNIQRTTAVNILNNREKYEAIVTECDNIFHTIEGMLTPQQQPSQAYKQEEFEAFKIEVAEKLSMQQDILMKMASELGLK